MIANLKNAQVQKMAETATAHLDLFREANPTMRTAQFMRVTDILIMCRALTAQTTVQLSLDDFKALTQLPKI